MILLVSLLQDPFRIDSVGFFTTGSIFVLILMVSLLQDPFRIDSNGFFTTDPDTEGSREGQPEVPKIPLLKSRFFTMWAGPFSSPGGRRDFSEAEPSREGSKVTNLHEASRK